MMTLQNPSPARSIPGLSPPRQKRSAIAQQRILESLERLLQERDYMEIAVSDIAKEAGCAVGGVYNRFKSKDHILLALAQNVTTERINPRYEKQENPGWHSKMSVQEFLEIYFSIIAMPYVEFRYIFRPLAAVSRLRKEDEFFQFLDDREKEIQAHMVRVLTPLARADNQQVNKRKINLAVFWMRSLFNEYVLFGDKICAHTGVCDDRYFIELSHLIGLYLASPETGKSLQ